MKRLGRVAFALSAVSMFTATTPVFAGEIEDLKAAVQKLVERIEQLESQQKTQAAAPVAAAPVTAVPENVVTAGSLPGSIKVPGTDTSLKIYGHVQTNATYDLKGRNRDVDMNDWSDYLAVQPLDKTTDGKRKNQLFLTARTSRLGLETSTPTGTDMGNLQTKIEGDFNSPNTYSGESLTNGSLFRIRYAYGTLGNFLVGQTVSNFTDLGSFSDSVDFNSTGNVTLVRQAQVRYTLPINAFSSLALSVENSQSRDIGSTNFDRTPDFVANLTTKGNWGHFSLRGLVQDYRNDLHSKTSFGLGIGGSIKLGQDTLVAQINGGKGIGRYMLNSFGQGAYDDGTQIHLWNAIGGHVGYTHAWVPAVRSNLIFSHMKFSGDDTLEALTSQNKKINEALINTFWKVAKNTELGLEYAYGKRTTFAGDDGTQNRVNATLRHTLF